MFSKLKILWVWLILIIVGLVVYTGSFKNQFVWDDEEQVVNNQAVHSLKNLPQFFGGSTFNTGGTVGKMGGMYYKPLMSLSFALIYSLAGPRPFYFHLFQVSLHIFNAGLVFIFFKTLFDRFNQTVEFQSQIWVSFYLALIFLIHPINVEAVVYISSLQDVLSFCFGLGASLIVLRKKLEFKWLVALFFSFLFSLLAKETGLIWLIFVPILSWLLGKENSRVESAEDQQDKNQTEQSWRRWSFTASGASFLLYMFLRLGVAKVGFHSRGVSPIIRLNFGERVWSIPKIIWHYLSTYFWPLKLAIAEYWLVLAKNLTWDNFYGPLLGVTLLFSFLLWLTVKAAISFKQSWARFSLIFMTLFMLGLGLHLQIFPLDMTVADRWFYLPQLGILGGVGLGLFWLQKHFIVMSKKGVRSGLLIMGLIIVVGLSYRSIKRIGDWQNGLILYAHDIQLEPNSFDLVNNYGVELYRAERMTEAKKYFKRSTELAPHWWTNWNNLGVVVENEGQLKLAADYYQKAIDHGQYFLAYQNLARVKTTQNPQLGLEFIEKNLPLLPYNAELYLWQGVALYQLGRQEVALKSIERSFQLSPQKRTTQLYQKMKSGQELNLTD